MLARGFGVLRELTDYQLIVRFSGIGKTSLETGTEPEGIAAMVRSLGKRPVIHPGADLAFMRRSLARGAPVIANGEYYAMPPHEDPSEREGHWILVYGIAPGGAFLVHDSEDPAVRTVSPAAMERYLREHERGGFQVSVNNMGR
jgi:hypothetical protein